MASARKFAGYGRRPPGAKVPQFDLDSEFTRADPSDPDWTATWIATEHPLAQLTDTPEDWPEGEERLRVFLEANEAHAKTKGWNMRELLLMFLVVEGRDPSLYGFESDPYVQTSTRLPEIGAAVEQEIATWPEAADEHWVYDSVRQRVLHPLSERPQVYARLAAVQRQVAPAIEARLRKERAEKAERDRIEAERFEGRTLMGSDRGD